MILEFTNGIFQGKVSNGYNFSKTGIFLWDDSSFLVGKFFAIIRNKVKKKKR